MKNKLRGLIMEILSNFSSIYCFITFVIGAVFMLAILSIAAMGKTKEPKVRFYVKRVHDGFELWMKDRYGTSHHMYNIVLGNDFLIDTKSFRDMEHGEIREVNLMED